MQRLETEIKLRIDSFPDYLKLLGCLGPMDTEEHQRSAFFDSEDQRLGQAGWALRVRIEGRRGLITLKGMASDHGLAVTRREIEAEVPRAVASEVCDLRRDILSLDAEPVEVVKRDFPGISLTRLVMFDNLRRSRRMQLGDGVYTLEVDKTQFPDGSVEYELEVEVTDPEEAERVEEHLRRMFGSLGIPFVRQSETKLARALHHLGAI